MGHPAEQAQGTMLKVLTSFKSSEIEQAVNSLDRNGVDLLMKYIYKGFEKPTENSSAILLQWHEKAGHNWIHGCLHVPLARTLPFGTKEQLPGEPQLHPALASISCSECSSSWSWWELQELLLQALEVPPQARGLAPRLLQLRSGPAQLLGTRLQLLLCSAQAFFLLQKLHIGRLSLALQTISNTDKPACFTNLWAELSEIINYISDLISIILCEEGEGQTKNGQTLGKDIFR
ncbi:hypothetical protein DV515_00013293, partial [Chloebia gouldiae]